MSNIKKGSVVRVSRLEIEDKEDGINIGDLYNVVTPYGDNPEDTAVVQCLKIESKISTPQTIQRFWISQLINDNNLLN